MPKFAKGSPEAKAFMAKLRAMRGKRSGKVRGGSYTTAALDGFGKKRGCRGGSYTTAALDGFGKKKSSINNHPHSYTSSPLMGFGKGYDDYIIAAAVSDMPKKQQRKLMRGGFDFGSFLRNVSKYAGNVSHYVSPTLQALGASKKDADKVGGVVDKIGKKKGKLELSDFLGLLS